MDNGIINAKQGAFAMLDPNSGFSQYGLTKREYFAVMAMQGLLANSEISKRIEKYDNKEWIERESLFHADTLLKLLDK